MKVIKIIVNILIRRMISILVMCFFTNIILFLYNIRQNVIEEINYYAITSWFIYSLVMSYMDYRQIITIRENGFSKREIHLPLPRDLIEKECFKALESVVQQKQEQIEKMKSANMELTDQFTLWMHNIKTPITGLKLIIDNNMKDSEVKDEAVNQILIVKQNLDAVMNLVSLTEGNNDLLFQHFDITDVINEVLRNNSWSILQKKQHIILSDKFAVINSDKKWFRTLIEQLIINANKYTPVGGTISILSGKGLQLVLISDTGIGISPKDIPRIFESGFTGEAGRKYSNASGMGLYIVKNIEKLLLLNVQVKSQKNQGTTFIVSKKTKNTL